MLYTWRSLRQEMLYGHGMFSGLASAVLPSDLVNESF